MKQAVSYSRFSSSVQAKGSSLERQREMFRTWLATNSHRFYESSLSRQDKGLSAYKKEHLKGGLGEIVAAIDAGLLTHGDALVIEAIDRLSRSDTMDVMGMASKIVENGVIIVTLEDNQEFTRQSLNTAQFFLFAAKIQAANNYSAKLGMRVAAAWEKKRQAARNGVAPAVIHSYPMWINKQTKKLNEHAPMVREAVELYLRGEGLREICYLVRNKYGFALTDRNLGRWLDNYDAMLGKWHDVQAFEPLLTQQVFFEIQEARRQRTRTPKQPTFHKTSGLLVCADCGTGFVFRTQKPAATKSAPIGSEAYKQKPKIVYGNCRAYLHNKACANNSSVPEVVALLIYEATKSEPLLEIAMDSALGVLDRRVHAGLIEKKSNLQSEFDTLYELYKKRLIKPHDEERMQHLRIELEELDRRLREQGERDKKADTLLMQQRKNDKLFLGSKNMLFGFGNADAELESAVRAETEKLEVNPFLLRLALKNYGYKIMVSRQIEKESEGNSKALTVLEVNTEEAWSHSWKILRRSQKLGCYLVEHTAFEEGPGFHESDPEQPQWVEIKELLEVRRCN